MKVSERSCLLEIQFRSRMNNIVENKFETQKLMLYF